MWWIATTPLAPVGAAGARHTPRSRAPRAPRRSSCPRGMRRSSCAPCHSVKVSAVNPRSAMPRRSGMAAARIQRSSSVSASMSVDSRLVLSMQGQPKVRLLVQPGPPTQRAGSRPAARVRAGPWPSGHPRAAARCPENRPSTEPEGGSGCGDHPARVLVRQPNHQRPVTFPPEIVDGFCRCRRGSTSNMSWSRHTPTSSGTGNGQRRAGSPSKDRSIALYLLL